MTIPLDFEWDDEKDIVNQLKHGVSFSTAQKAFEDPNRVIHDDLEHSEDERRSYCFAKLGGAVLTVRFTYRGNRIRIFGAGYWRNGGEIYEKENRIH